MSTDCPPNGHVVLKQRPGNDGEPQEGHFAYSEIPYPSDALFNGQLLIKNLLLSVDPALRWRMNEECAADFMDEWKIDVTLNGFGGVGKVVDSSDPDFQPGDIVVPVWEWPWKNYFILESKQVQKLPKEMSGVDHKLLLSLFGNTGLTAYLGITEQGHITPGHNQTVVITAAAGSTGMIAGQVAKAEGCVLLVGLCGSDAKCKVLTEELGFDVAINYKTENVSERLEASCPKGIDVYFDNVGGEISSTIIKQMNENSHLVLCGQISDYNKDVPFPSPIPEEDTKQLKEKNITREGFFLLAHKEKFTSSLSKLKEFYLSGKVKVKETVERGLENTPRAFVSLMAGGNIGKQIVEVAKN